MVTSPDSDIERLLSEVSSIYNNGKQQVPSAPTSNIAPQSTGYQAPLKGTWHSSGGFDLNAIRPNGRKGHGGVDMRAPAGTPIYPLAPGVVTNVGTDPLGGNIVNVQHANGVRSYYAHCSTVKAQKGDKVNNDTVLGNVGNTGNASHTFPHLHFQVWKDGQLTDPAHFFTVPAYTNLSGAEQKQGPWLSEQAKQDAQAFNMQKHINQGSKTAFSTADKLLKIAYEYSKIIDRSK